MKYLILIFLFPFPFLCLSQENFSSSYNIKGDLNIANWQPANGQNGASINSISLEYSYGTDSLEPKQAFNFIWYLGNQVFIDGKNYKKEEIGEKLFGKIGIASVTFKAKVYANEKFISEIVINYPSIIPKSGKKSGWYITGSPEWEEVFENISAEKTKELFQNGFVLRQPQIMKIEFSGLDPINQMLLEKEMISSITNTSNNSTVNFNNSTTSISSRQKGTAKKRNNKNTYKIFIEDFRLDIRTGNIYLYRGLSWHVNINVGIGYTQFPLNSISYKQTRYNVFPNLIYDTLITRKYCRTPIVKAGVELWPLFGDHFGAGILGNFYYGWFPSISKTADINFGAKIYGGAKPLKITVEYLSGYRFGEYKYDFQKGFDGGTVFVHRKAETDFSFQRIGVGGIAWIDNKRPLAIELMVLFEKSDLSSSNQKQFSVFRISLWTHNGIRTGFEFIPEYKNAGNLIYKVNPEYQSSGIFINLFFSKSFDFFGTKYFSSLKKGNL